MTPATATRRVLLITMGGPRNASEVKPFLRRLFADPYVLGGNPLKRLLLSRIIARAAAPKSRARYAMIGGGSTAVQDAVLLAGQLREAFASRGITLECSVATRYATPNIEDALESLSRSAGAPVTPVYLFPHETSAMTGSCAHVLERASAKLAVPVEAGVRRLGATDAYARGWANAIQQATQVPGDTFVLFSCHSLPRATLERGDPYVSEVEHSVELVRSCLGAPSPSSVGSVLPGSSGRRPRRPNGLRDAGRYQTPPSKTTPGTGLAYQSQEGADWLGPTVEELASQAYARGFRELIVAPLSFVGENTETLVDLDRELRAAALAMGFRRVERLGTPNQLGFLRAVVVEALCREWGLEWEQAK